MDKIKICELGKMVDPFDVFDFVETEVKACKIHKILKAFDVWNQVVVEIQLGEGIGETWKPFDFVDSVLTEAQSLHFLEAGEI